MAVIANLHGRRFRRLFEGDRRARAWALLSIPMGGVNIARAMESNETAEEVTASVKAIEVAGDTCVLS